MATRHLHAKQFDGHTFGMEIMEQLKPCPFCGKTVRANWYEKESQLFLSHETIFGGCPLHLGLLIIAPDKKRAIAKWNRRAENEDI